MNKIREWISLRVATKPRMVILNIIIFINLLISILGALAVFIFYNENNIGFWEAFYYSFSIVITGGGIENIIPDVSEANITLIILGTTMVLFGMIVFSGAVLGYVVSYISDFIERASKGEKKLYLQNHIVILNWNIKVNQIISDLLYENQKEKVVILTQGNKDEVMKTIENKLSDIIEREEKRGIKLNRKLLTIVVVEGNSFSVKDLNDISIKKAKSIIIFGRKDYREGSSDNYENFYGDILVIKSFVQVLDMIRDTKENINVVVETRDAWTSKIVKNIMQNEITQDNISIKTIDSNIILGQLLSQFWIMPELNLVYRDLFSYKGAEFHSSKVDNELTDTENMEMLFKNDISAIPLTVMGDGNDRRLFYIADDDSQKRVFSSSFDEISFKLSGNSSIERKKLILLGSNSKLIHIINSLDKFYNEYKDRNEDFEVLIIDDKEGIKENKEIYKKSYISDVIEVDIYNVNEICEKIESFMNGNDERISILILSNDNESLYDQDAFAIMYLLYIKEVICNLSNRNKNFDKDKIDIIIEIVNPQNIDVIRSYDVDNFVVSNEYVSNLITQIGNNESLYEFYMDILHYDDLVDINGNKSKEIYIKRVDSFFDVIPDSCNVYQLIKAVYDSTPKENKVILIGYIRNNREVNIFTNSYEKEIKLRADDKLIIFSKN